jgi:hypothetical protein
MSIGLNVNEKNDAGLRNIIQLGILTLDYARIPSLQFQEHFLKEFNIALVFYCSFKQIRTVLFQVPYGRVQITRFHDSLLKKH